MDGQRDAREIAATLLSADAVRQRAAFLFDLAERDALPHFRYRSDRLAAAVDYVDATIRAAYPSGEIPFHSRWRHFTAGGVDRWAVLERTLVGVDAAERARIRFDLAATSVLLDAGAGPTWRYREAGGGEYQRSEALAVASFHVFRAGLFSADERQPLRADAAALKRLSEARLADGFQVSAQNPLIGLAGRLELLHRLGGALQGNAEMFGGEARFGRLFDWLCARAVGGAIPAPAILAAILRGLGSIWPGRHVLGGVPLGDVWVHGEMRGLAPDDHYVPLHKLSQWLSYSLIEPIEAAGWGVSEIDRLTGLAEYRNGGLMLDTGLLEPRDAELLRRGLRVEEEPVVEWRALTVGLLDRIAMALRGKRGCTAEEMPLARVLEGGTWTAGRRLAAELRRDGAPPLSIISDGTVF